jgi:hypothetical protein
MPTTRARHSTAQVTRRPMSIAYLDEFNALNAIWEHAKAHPDAGVFADGFNRVWDGRERLIAKYAWAIPNAEALEAIAAIGRPVVEMGAGTGYWASLLGGIGLKVVAFDRKPPNQIPNPWHSPSREVWTDVRKGRPRDLVPFRRSHALFLCWPSPTGMAGLSLCYHKASHVAYIGEPPGGETGDARFFEILHDEYRLRRTVEIPRWWMHKDRLEIWGRRRKR